MDERLEIIKDKQLQMHALSTFDIKHLIDQAEKVPGLERDRKYWYETYQQQKELSRGQKNKLQERVQELERRNKELAEGIEFNNKEYGKVIDENNRYKEVMEFYANPQIWKEGKLITDNRYEMPLAYNDNGEKAQQALKGSGEYKN